MRFSAALSLSLLWVTPLLGSVPVLSHPVTITQSNRQQSHSQEAQQPAASGTDATARLLFQGDRLAQQALATNLLKAIESGVSPRSFGTGSVLFDAEWTFGTYQMAVLGLGQVMTAHPNLREAYLPAMEQSLERLLSPKVNAFATQKWRENGLETLESNNGHAYLGYTNLALSMLRVHDRNNRFAALNDRVTAALIRRLSAAPHGLIETYPKATYPVDVAAAIASISLYDRATGQNHQALLSQLIRQFRQVAVDPKTGLVYQAMNATTGKPTDQPRASGTTLSAYFLSFADKAIAQDLARSIARQQVVEVFGLTGIREYPPGQTGSGDLDSGKLVGGASPTATVFALAGARLTGNEPLYRQLYATIQLAPALPLGKMADARLLESPLGHALLLAMLTAGS